MSSVAKLKEGLINSRAADRAASEWAGLVELHSHDGTAKSVAEEQTRDHILTRLMLALEAIAGELHQQNAQLAITQEEFDKMNGRDPQRQGEENQLEPVAGKQVEP